MAKQYRVEVIEEGILGNLLVGASKFPIKKLEAFLNEASKEGWELEFMIKESRRKFIFSVEAAIVTLSKNKK